MLSAKENQVLNTIAADLGTTPAALSALITFESGFNPKAKNPYSSARGLIQFTDTTARGLGFKDSLDLITRFSTIEKQLLLVHKYLKKYAPFRDDQALFMAVFYPAARDWPITREFPDYVQAVNPGIKTVLDYVNKVYGKKKAIEAAGAGAGALALIAAVLFFIFRKGKT
jgi:hypothetical protein